MARLLVLAVVLLAGNALAKTCKPEHNCKLEKLGCYNDNYQRTMPELLLSGRDTSSPSYDDEIGEIKWDKYEKYILDFACRCATIASEKGYTVIGLQFYGECWSGPDAAQDYAKYGKSKECIDTKYQPSSDNTCGKDIGKSWTNYVFRLATPGCAHENIEPVGCFHDNLKAPRPVPTYTHNERDYSLPNWNGHLIDWEHWLTYSPAMVCRCQAAAKKAGHNYFAIQFWGECWTGTDADVHFARNGVSTNCRDEYFKPCTCNSYICVGMAYTNYVYKFKSDVPCPVDDADNSFHKTIEIW